MKSLSQRPRPGAFCELQRCAACHGTRRSARIRRLPELTKRLTSDVVIPNGGFDTTLKGLRGRRRSEASARTTVT
jgi:hypothetical protein